MNKVLKLIIISLIAVAVVLTAVILIGNLCFTVNTIETDSEQVASISGEDLDNDLLIARSYGYENRLVVTYVPRTSGQQINLYADYEIKEDGTTVAAENHRPYEDVSVDNPITFEVQRKPSSVYELDISVEDTEGNLVHKSSVTIGSKNNYN